MLSSGSRELAVEVRAEHLSHRFGSFQALKNVSLTVRPGQFVSLLGSSGSGKTTLLRIIAGLLQPDAGRIFIDDRDVTRLSANKRDIGFVFQNYALFPHLTVFENVAFALRLRRAPASEIQRRVHLALEKVYLQGLASRYPAELSGGQQQRVALARAIVFEPTVLLMDEPLGSLDKRLRQQLQLELRNLQREVGITTIYVTHDQDEAFSLSDEIAVMSAGEIQQLASPEEIYRNPVNSFVAHFVGDLNLLEGRLAEDQGEHMAVETRSGLRIRVANPRQVPIGAAVGCGVRPEKVRVGLAPTTENSYRATVRTLTFHGSHCWAELVLAPGDIVLAIMPEASGIREGSVVHIGWNAAETLVFPSHHAAVSS